MSNIICDESQPGYQLCTRCIMDTSVPRITFDENGVCSYCHLHDALDAEHPLNDEGQKKLDGIIAAIKKSGKGKKFDCICGISGGRDSTYNLWYVVKKLGLRPLAVHFNDGFGNPSAGENMLKTCDKLGVELRTVTSDWRESKDIKLAFLKASTPDMEEGTDLGIATSLYGAAAKENCKYILIGQSFRTEGVSPLEWNYLDGAYLHDVHKKFGTVPLRAWSPEDPGFHLGVKEMAYYTVLRGIKTIPLPYYLNYVRKDVDALLVKELDWVDPGAHYYDDLYQSIYTYALRTKFNIDRRRTNYSALVRSGQMERDAALESVKTPYSIEDPKVIDLCIKRLGLTREQFDAYMALEPKTFRDYNSSYKLIRLLRPFIWLASKMHFLPSTAYPKYFKC